MLNIVKNKKYNFNESFLASNCITEKNLIIKNDSQISGNINTIFYPSSSKEWYNNIYSFNKSYIKSLISKYTVLNKLFRSYSNMLPDKIKILYKT